MVIVKAKETVNISSDPPEASYPPPALLSDLRKQSVALRGLHQGHLAPRESHEEYY